MTGSSELGILIALPTELLQALGEVSARYGQVEHILTMTIIRTTVESYDEVFAEVANSNLKYRDKICRKVKSCFKDWAVKKFGEAESQQRSGKFDNLIQAWSDLAQRRHDVIHCCWSVIGADKRLGRTRKGKLFHSRSEDVAVLGEDLKQFVVLLNKETLTGTLTGQPEEIADLPKKFEPGRRVGPSIETASTITSLITPSFVEPFDD